MSTSNNKDSDLKRKQRTSEVAPTDGAEHQLVRLASSIWTPTKDMQTSIKQEKQGDKPYDDKMMNGRILANTTILTMVTNLKN